MNKLTGLPNIGPTLAKKLTDAGIASFDELSCMGAEKAFLRISSGEDSGCFNMLCALEGAIRGIRWHNLPGKRKNELREFLKLNQARIT